MEAQHQRTVELIHDTQSTGDDLKRLAAISASRPRNLATSAGKILVDTAETASGTYVRASWLNGILPLHADVTHKSMPMLERLAAELDVEIDVTNAAREILAGGNQ